ncbi:MAG: YggT family protein [Anaerolineales bacterium]|nr:YggT family protein [Anaerolineales bacterium]
MILVIQIIDLVFTLLTFAIIANAIMSWLPMDRYNNPVARVLDQITAPILEPLRRVIPPIGMMDVTPIVALIVLQVLQTLIHNLLIGLY